jgi:RNA recognition motif-containing protein
VKKLIVGNMPHETTEDELHRLFTEYGEVESVELVMQRNTGRPRGFGFVQMRNEFEADTAKEELCGRELGGRELTVNDATPKREDYRRRRWG